MPAGRYAPSPSGDLHLGNLRTAILAWLFAASTGRDLLLRYEDLDAGRTVAGSAERQLADLHAVGVRFTGDPVWQSQRTELYDDAVAQLAAAGLTYECFCTRREIHEAARAPHAPPGTYPGTCRHLTEEQRSRRRAQRPPATRLRSAPGSHTVTDQLLGQVTAMADDVVLRRNDGTAAYHLAVVVDDHLTGVDQVVRGDDLASAAPQQASLRGLLYGDQARDAVQYAHVPLVLNTERKRLAKRDGAVTLAALKNHGVTPQVVRDRLLQSLGLPVGPLAQVLEHFDPSALPREPWVVPPEDIPPPPELAQQRPRHDTG